MRCFVLLPCYNEQHSLPYLIEQIHKVLNPTAEFLQEKNRVANLEDYQIIALDDGSTDNTLLTLMRLKKQFPLTVLEHGKNKGLAEAYRTLFQYIGQVATDDDAVIMMDANSTHDPYLITNLLSEHSRKVDVAVASRYLGKEIGTSFLRRLLSKGINLLIHHLCQVPIQDCTSGFRCYRATWLKHLQLDAKGFEVSAETLIKIAQSNPTPKLVEIPMLLRYDKKQSLSKMNLRHTVKAYLKLLWKHTRIDLTTPIQQLAYKLHPKLGRLYDKDPKWWNDGIIALAFLCISFYTYTTVVARLPWYLHLLWYVFNAFWFFSLQHLLRRFWVFQK